MVTVDLMMNVELLNMTVGVGEWWPETQCRNCFLRFLMQVAVNVEEEVKGGGGDVGGGWWWRWRVEGGGGGGEGRYIHIVIIIIIF
ncbi:hypothetical protein Hanom_Chr06g00521011 [Helianthus anomalus]